MSKILYYMRIVLIAGACIPAFYSFKKYENIDLAFLFDIFVILSLIHGVVKFKYQKRSLNFALALAAYIVFCACFAIIIESRNIIDFAIIYKSVFYLLVLNLVNGALVFKQRHLKILLYGLVSLFLIKYSLSHVVGGNHRPIFFAENNFELPLLMLALLSAFRYEYESRAFNIALSMVTVVIILSLSSSGILSLLFLIFFMKFYGNHSVRFRKTKVVAFAIIATITVIVTFFIRYEGDLENIDRLRFVQSFWESWSNRSFFEVIFGAPPITPLLPESCGLVAYMEDSKFSYSGDGSCYSVVLHAYLLRALHDFGIVFTLLIFININYLLRYSGVEVKARYAALGVILANSLSVSGLSNPFIITGLILMITGTHFKRYCVRKNSDINNRLSPSTL